ncbi:MAG: hypothetical protein Tsb0010_06570 [Parvularculaceae bacterium]
MRYIDYAFSAALILFAAGHGFLGVQATYALNTPEAMWSFSGGVLAWMIAAVNILRVSRPGDRGVAIISLAGALTWIGLMAWLAPVSGMAGDIRLWLFVGSAAGLAAFSLYSLRAPKRSQA